MKKTVIILFLIISCSLIYAQAAYINAGYNFMNGSFKKLNSVLDRYNDDRADWNLDPKMDKINSMHGFTYEYGFIYSNIQGGIGLQYNSAETTSKWIVPDDVTWQKDLSLKSYSIPFEIGVVLGKGGFTNIPGLGNGHLATISSLGDICLTTIPGLGYNFMVWRYLTRSGPADEIKSRKFNRSNKHLCMHLKLYVKFIIGRSFDSGLGFMIEPYYNLGLVGSNINEFDQLLNDHRPYQIIEKFSHYGIRMLLVLKLKIK